MLKTRQRHKIGADLAAFDIRVGSAGLPFIKGTWFFVDPDNGSNSSDGLTIDTAVADLLTAYGLCVSGRGDGIALLSGGTSAAETTSYLTHELAWSKHAITVFGVAAPARMFGRARIATKTITTGAITVLSFLRGTVSADTINRTTGSFITDGFKVGDYLRVDTTGNGADATGLVVAAVSALTLTLATTGTLVTETAANAGSSTVSTYCPNIITVTGDNNSFINIHAFNANTDALSLGGWVDSGHRNYYENCHFVGGAGCAASASIRSIELATSEEATFTGCTFGSDTVDRGNNANSELLFTGAVSRSRFYDCEFLVYVSTGTAHGAIKTAAATALGNDAVFKRCEFHAFAANGINAQTVAVIGTAPTTGIMYILDSSAMAYTNWADAANDRVYVNMPTSAAAAAGGICTVR